MERKKRISIVAGKLVSSRLLKQFEPLTLEYDVTAYVFNKKDVLNGYDSCIKLTAYDEIKDMPGYMRGLEDELKLSDAILAVESTCLSSFQACRAARKQIKPFVVYSTEWQTGLYEAYPNIKAIQYDVLNNASHFFSATEATSKYLEWNEVDPAICSKVPYVVSRNKFSVDPVARNKFRKYIGINEKDVVLLHSGELSSGKNSDVVLKLFDLLRNVDVIDSDNLKLIIAGDGEVAKELKYLSHDLGLGSSVFFLHQSIEPFAQDLYNASDFVVVPATNDSQEIDPIPFDLLEMMACGVVPFVVSGTKEANLVGESAVSVRNSRHDEFAIAISHLISSRDRWADARKKVVERIELVHTTSNLAPKLSAVLDDFFASNLEHPSKRAAENFKKLQTEIDNGESLSALVGVEQMLLELEVDELLRSEVLRAKGDIKYSNGEYDDSLVAYQESLQVDPKNGASFRGLGFVAWQSHSNEEAISFFKKSLAIEETDSQTMLGLGLVHRRVGLVDQSIYWFEKSLSVKSPSKIGITALTQACGECRNPAVGIASLKRVIDLIGEERTLLIGLGSLYLRTGRTAEGQTLVDKALNQAS